MITKSNIKLGIHPVGWTNDDLPQLGAGISFEQCIDEISCAGYEGTEIGNKFPKDRHILKEALRQKGLGICSAWFSTFFTTNARDETVNRFKEYIEFLRFLGAKVIGCSEQGNSIQCKPISVFKDKPIYTNREWSKVISGMNMLGEIACKEGMKLCVHHHMGTGIQTPSEIRYLMENASPNVHLLFDTGHLLFSEGDTSVVYALLDRYIDRIAHVHLKDIRLKQYNMARKQDMSFLEAIQTGVFTVPGDGVIDFSIILKVLLENNYQGWIVVEADQDPDKANPMEYAVMAKNHVGPMLERISSDVVKIK